MKFASMPVIAVTTVVCAAAFAAQPPQQCVNPETVNGLVFLGRSDNKVEVTRGLPASMAGFRAPTGFSLIGTGVRPGGTTTIAYKTSLGIDKAHAAVMAALAADGWAVEASAGSNNTFKLAGGPGDGIVCRNGERRSLLVTETAGTTYAAIRAAAAAPRDCGAPEPAPATGLEVRNAAPRFQFPAGTSLAPSLGGGGSSTMSTVSSRVISEETPARLVEHLASQIAAQGWQRESGWSGSAGAGSTWRRVSEDAPAFGSLEIVRVSEGTYDVDFTMTMPR